jgi:hypothetical protein
MMQTSICGAFLAIVAIVGCGGAPSKFENHSPDTVLTPEEIREEFLKQISEIGTLPPSAYEEFRDQLSESGTLPYSFGESKICEWVGDGYSNPWNTCMDDEIPQCEVIDNEYVYPWENCVEERFPFGYPSP